MTRLSTLLRVALIVLIAATTLWLLTLGLYRAARQGEEARPAPARIAAVAAAVEATPEAQRAALLAAFSSPTLSFALAPGAPQEGVPKPRAAEDAGLLAGYRAALGGRAVTLSDLPSERRRFSRLWHSAWNAFELQVGLRGGGSLVIDARPILLLMPFGLPTGLPAGIFGTLVALGALIVMQAATRPLSALARAVERMDLSGRAELPDVRASVPEIRAVGEAIARLQGRLAELLAARMALVGGIAHDVRTFATRLRLRIDLIPEEAERARAAADIDDMIGLLDAALMAARAGAVEIAREMLEFDALVAEEVADRRAHGRAVTLAPGAEGLTVLGDRLALRRAVANLVENALTYGQAARLSLRRDGENAALDVEDDGPGIPEPARAAMLEPFTRLDSWRNRRTGGAGLGLAVVRALAEAHGGGVAISDSPGGGARVTLSLPLFRPEPGDSP